MKTKGRRQSKNVSDVRGPTGAYARPSGLTRAKAFSDAGKQMDKDQKSLRKAPSKLAKEAGAEGIGKKRKK